MSKKVLGKGIGALLGEEAEIDQASISEVPVSALKPNPQQPRREFDETALRELADSIRQKGVLQPVLAEPSQDGTYVIIAGERRVRAARLAGIDKVPVIVRQFTAEEKLEIALIENVQREDLNPIEEALAYRNLMDMAGLSQEQIAAQGGQGQVHDRQHSSTPQAFRTGSARHRERRSQRGTCARHSFPGQPV